MTNGTTRYHPAGEPTRRNDDVDGQSSAAMLEPGRVLLDRYEIVERIGTGGTGAVFKAIDRLKANSDEDSTIALKVMHDSMGAESKVRALVQEVSRSHALNHPNIVHVFDVAQDGDLIIMTMEYLDGRSLADHVEMEGPLPVSVADRMLADLLSGLKLCHDKGIVHADIKPENVFLTASMEVRLLDLGISQVIGKAGQFGGYTPGYASPEQILGHTPDKPDDIYSMGCLMYVCLLGEHPFGWKPAHQAMAEGLEPKFSGALPRRYRKALKSALAFTRAERPADAGALWRILDPRRVRLRQFAMAGTVLAASAAMAIGGFGVHMGTERIQVSAEDQARAEASYQQALGYLNSNPARGRDLLVGQVLKLNPYHEAASQTLAQQIRMLLDADDPAALSYLQEGLKEAPKATPLDRLARQQVDQVLDHHDPASLGLLERSLVRAPLCLPVPYRRQEVEAFKRAAKVDCS